MVARGIRPKDPIKLTEKIEYVGGIFAATEIVS